MPTDTQISRPALTPDNEAAATEGISPAPVAESTFLKIEPLL